jgi:hypothetical protein
MDPTCECALCGMLLDEESTQTLALYEPKFMQEPRHRRIDGNSPLCRVCFRVALLRGAQHYLNKTIDIMLSNDPENWDTNDEDHAEVQADCAIGYITLAFPKFTYSYNNGKNFLRA